MQTPPIGPIYWLGNIYIGKFENFSIKDVLGHLFSHKAPQFPLHIIIDKK